MKHLIETAALGAFIHLPIVAWLQPPFFASWAIGVAAFCLARASLASVQGFGTGGAK
jgi:hypothetical protein